MAGSFDLLFVQDFSSSASVVVTHNQDLFQVGVRVIIGGQVRQDLVDSIEYTVGDPRNELTVNLSSAQTGTIQIVNNDVSWANFSTPANASMIGAGALETKVGNTLYVDAVNGDDATAISGRLDKSYLTIAAALGAAVSGDLVYVLPGTYDETSLVIPDDVTLAGIDRVRCRITHSTISNTTVVTLGANTCLANLSITGGSDPFPTGGRVLVQFPGTTSETAVARNLLLTGSAGAVSCINVAGSGVSAGNWVTIDHVDCLGSGVSNGLWASATGSFVVRDCLFTGLVGTQIQSGTVELQDCKISGLTGLLIAAGGTATVNQATRWNSLTNNGTLSSSLLYLHPAAGGDLSGTMPSPAVSAITETTGPTQLVIGAIADGQFLTRSGATLIGAAGGGGGVDVEEDGSSIGATFDTLNFIGLSATDAGGGTANVEYEGTAAFANYYHDTSYAGITTTASTLPFNTARITSPNFTLASNELTINTAGTYRVDFGCSSDENENDDNTVEIWLELDTGGGFAEVGGTRARWFHDSGEEEGGNASFAILELDATDVLRVRGQVVDGNDQINTLANSLRLAIQTIGKDGAAGATGPQGPTGSGSDIIVEDEGTSLPNTPHSNLNFVGAGVTATDAGAGVATITIPGGAGANIAQYRRAANQTINTSATTITLDATDFEDSNYTRSGADITINTAGVYKISYNVYFDTTANARRTVDAWCENNTSIIVPSRSAGYARNNTDDTASAGATFMCQLSGSDVVRLRAQSTGTSGTAQGEGNRIWICLEYMRS